MVAGALLMQMPVEEAFWVFVMILEKVCVGGRGRGGGEGEVNGLQRSIAAAVKPLPIILQTNPASSSRPQYIPGFYDSGLKAVQIASTVLHGLIRSHVCCLVALRTTTCCHPHPLPHPAPLHSSHTSMPS